uniref:Sieve element occlusion N-terminal domain-containing protein n=1 Tax=Fagus sylvatica TaxID=28930 RepID=A0A2N9GAY3_FAGSY
MQPTSANEKLDVESLLIIAENILNRATLAGTQETIEQWEEKTPKAGFSPPLCTLKLISYEMNCKAGPSDEIAHETTLSILEKLSSYSWDAKAVLTLANFALEYGEFCVACTNSAIGPTCQFSKNLEEASTTQLSCIFSDEDKKQELNDYAVKLNVILPKLKNQIAICKEQRAETEAYGKLVNLFRTSMEITEVLTGLIDPTNKMQPLIEGSTKELLHVEIDVLKTKNVLLFISDLDISDADISILRSISDKIGKEDHCKIVWIPFMEKWTKEQKDKFESLQSNMPGYIARYNLKIASCRFIKEQWHFKGKPLLVVLNSQGQVECENAMHMIRVYGVESYPFTRRSRRNSVEGKNVGLSSRQFTLSQEIPRWKGQATLVQNDTVLKEKGISIELVAVEKEKFERFWTSIESMFISKAQWKTETDDVGQEIQKLLSYKNESAWTVFTKGSSVLEWNRAVQGLCCKEGGGLELELKVELEGQAKRFIPKLESGRGRPWACGAYPRAGQWKAFLVGELELKVELEGQAKRPKCGRGRGVFLLGTVRDNSQSSSQPNPNSHDRDEG